MTSAPRSPVNDGGIFRGEKSQLQGKREELGWNFMSLGTCKGNSQEERRIVYRQEGSSSHYDINATSRMQLYLITHLGSGSYHLSAIKLFNYKSICLFHKAYSLLVLFESVSVTDVLCY